MTSGGGEVAQKDDDSQHFFGAQTVNLLTMFGGTSTTLIVALL